MDYNAFKREFEQGILDFMPADYGKWEMHSRQVYKVNRKLDAFSIQLANENDEKSHICPVFYMENLYSFYKDGIGMRGIMQYVADTIFCVQKRDEEQFDFDLHRYKDCIIMQLVNQEWNEEFLKTIPNRPFLNLAIIYRVVIYDKDGKWSGIIVTNDIMNEWKLTEKELYEIAWKHTRDTMNFGLKYFTEVSSTDKELNKQLEDFNKRIRFLTSENMQFGAVVMLYPDILEMTAEKLGGSFAIIPSSVHELIVLKEEKDEAKNWRSIVRSINGNPEVISAGDKLSDDIYYYDAEEKTVTVLW